MKYIKSQTKSRNSSSRAKPVAVQFAFSSPTAVAVSVAGTFNNWSTDANDLQRSAGGGWYREMSLTPGIYEYCLVVDGQWIPDPLAKETVSNPYGGRNSVVTVASSSSALHRSDAERLPVK